MDMRASKRTTTTAGPCIKLLQEKFRNLKRQREQREEKQLLLKTTSSSSSSCGNKKQHLPSSSSSSSTNLIKQEINDISEAHKNNTFSFTKDGLIMPARTCLDDPLSLGLNNLSVKHVDYRDMTRIKPQIVRQGDKRVVFKTSHKLKTRDLDTSLHL